MCPRVFLNRILYGNQPSSRITVLGIRHASTAKTIKDLMLKSNTELLCYKQPDEVESEYKNTDLEPHEIEFIKTGSDGLSEIRELLQKWKYPKLANTNSNTIANTIIPRRIAESSPNRRIYIKRVLMTDLNETKIELDTARKFINEYLELEYKVLSNVAFGKVSLLGGILCGYLVYEGVFPANYLSNLGLSAMVIGGLGEIIIFAEAHKLMKEKFEYLTYTQHLVIPKYEKKIEKLEKLILEL